MARTCWQYILKALGWARKYGLRVKIDLHTIPGSQNGEPFFHIDLIHDIPRPEPINLLTLALARRPLTDSSSFPAGVTQG